MVIQLFGDRFSCYTLKPRIKDTQHAKLTAAALSNKLNVDP